jgi:hypothetical protein
MKLTITGIVDKVGGIRPVNKGFTQAVILMQPEVKNEYDRVIAGEQYFVIHIWSNKQTDSRFLNSKHIASKMKAEVYLKGERWFNERQKDFNYNHKLNLQQWQS